MIVNHPRQTLQRGSRESIAASHSQSVFRLRWQSRLILLLAVVAAAATIILESWPLFTRGFAILVEAFALGGLLAFLTWKFRAATLTGAFAGGLFTAALYLATPGWATALWPLLALLLLTLAATRFGRARKEKLGVAESRHGRRASQVAANLGVAVLATVPIVLARNLAFPGALRSLAMRGALCAALAEAAADTLSSELGEVLGGEPYLLITFRRVSAGTDGAISLAGTLSGIIAAMIVAAVSAFALGFTATQCVLVALAAIAGLFVDSLLGALLERRGFLNNDAVNFLSTFASAVIAASFASK